MNIKHFLTENGVSYVIEGNNVVPGNVNIACPFCYAINDPDPSYHLGINLITGYFACWRGANHSGKDFSIVIQKLLNCNRSEAKGILKQDSVLLTKDSIADRVKNIFIKKEEENEIVGVTELKLLNEFKVVQNKGITKRFYDYFIRRGFSNKEKLDLLICQNNIRCCLTGYDKFMLIFPIYFQNKLMTWIKRSIYKYVEIKYKDYSKKLSVKHPKQLLYNYDILYDNGGTVCYVTEGVFDALKLNYLGFKATCLFTKTIRKEQILLLRNISKRFDEIRILLDKDAYTQAMKMKSELCGVLRCNLSFCSLPNGVKDPGDLIENNVKEFAL